MTFVILIRDNCHSDKIEQVRKGGLPPLVEVRGQAPLPDLFISRACGNEAVLVGIHE